MQIGRAGARATRTWPAAAVILLILVGTLWPARSGRPDTEIWCLVCGDLGGLDVLNNILLFMPFGAALVVAGWRWPRVVLAGAAFSFAIEALQFALIPGRDASLGDLITNTTGTFAGAMLAARPGWLNPTPRLAGSLLPGVCTAFVGVLAVTAFLLVPAAPPGPLYGQWAPRRPFFDPFTGRITTITINGLSVPAWEVTDPDAYRRAYLADSMLARAEITTGPASRFGLTPIMRFVSDGPEMLAFLQRRTSFAFRFRMRSADFRVHTLTLQVGGALPAAGHAVTLEGGRDAATLFARVVGPAGTHTTTVNLGASLGWALFLPLDVRLESWYQVVSDLWLACLALPLGFYAAAAKQDDRGSRARALAPALAAVVIGLGVVPVVAHFHAAHWSEWLGAGVGLFAGGVLSRSRRRPDRRG